MNTVKGCIFAAEITMKIVFEKEYLSELYHNSTARSKAYRFQPQVVKKYQRVVNILEDVDTIEDLFVFNSLNFEALSNGYYSVRIDYHYRLIFWIEKLGEETVVYCSHLADITNHYK